MLKLIWKATEAINTDLAKKVVDGVKHAERNAKRNGENMMTSELIKLRCAVCC